MSDTNEVQDGYENNLSDDSKSSIIASNDHSSFNPESPRSNFGYLLNPMLEAASLASRETQATGAPIINNSPSSTKFDPHDGKSDLNRNAGSIRGLLNTSLKNSSDSIHGARQAFFARSLDFGSELSNGGLSEINNDPKDFPPGRPPSPVSEITPTVAKEFSVDFYPTEKESYPRLPSISTLLAAAESMSTKDSRILDFQKSQKDFLRQPYANWVQSQRSLGNWRPSDGLITSDGINRVGIPAIASNTGSNVIVESDISNESNFKAGNSSSNSAGINANDDRKQSLQDKSPDSMKSIHEQAKYSMDRAINIDQKYYQLKKNTENLSHSNLKSGSRIYFDPRMQLSEQFFSQRYPSSENMSQSLGQKFQENRHLYYSSQRQNGHFSYQNLNNPTAIKPNFIISGHFKDANGREISRRVPIYPHQMNNIHTNPSDIKNNSNRPQTHPEYSLQRPSTFSGLAKQPTMHSLSIASGIQQPGSIPANENNTSTNGSQVRRCANCQTAETPSWRRCGPEQIILCNACGLYFIEHGHHRAFRIGIDGKTRALRRRKRSSPTPRSFNPIISAPDGSVSISYKEYQPKNFPDIRPN